MKELKFRIWDPFNQVLSPPKPFLINVAEYYELKLADNNPDIIMYSSFDDKDGNGIYNLFIVEFDNYADKSGCYLIIMANGNTYGVPYHQFIEDNEGFSLKYSADWVDSESELLLDLIREDGKPKIIGNYYQGILR